MRVALVHDWLTGMRGGEKTLEVVSQLFPGADLYTLVHVKGSVSRTIEQHPVHTSVVQWLPAVTRIYRHYLVTFPTAIEWLDLDGYDLVVSTSHCAAKAVLHPRPGTSVTALRRCGTPGTSSTPTSAQLGWAAPPAGLLAS